MENGRGALTRRARYVADMAALLAERAEAYESVIDAKVEETGLGWARCGYDVRKAESGTNIERMITQLRLELLELGRMV